MKIWEKDISRVSCHVVNWIFFAPLVQDGLRRWAKQIEAAYCLVNGRQALDDSELISGQVKTLSFLCHADATFELRHMFVLFSEEEPQNNQSSDTANTDLCLRREGLIL